MQQDGRILKRKLIYVQDKNLAAVEEKKHEDGEEDKDELHDTYLHHHRRRDAIRLLKQQGS